MLLLTCLSSPRIPLDDTPFAQLSTDLTFGFSLLRFSLLLSGLALVWPTMSTACQKGGYRLDRAWLRRA